MFTVSWIVSISLLGLSFFLMIFSAVIFAKPVDEYKFSFMRIFPFEVVRTAENNAKFYTFPTYLFAGMCFSPIIVVVSSPSSLSALNPMSIVISCTLGLGALCFLFLNVFDVTHVKPHLYLFGGFACLSILSGLLIFGRGLVGYLTLADIGQEEIIFLITEILAGLNVIFIFIILLNPKLVTWPKLDLVNGEYKRPKRFVLAYSEWAILLTLFINELIFFVQLLK